MDERAWSRAFQEIKSLTTDQFRQELNTMHSRSYSLAIRDVKEAMECTDKLYKPMIAEVFRHLNKIRGDWNGVPEVKTEDTISYRYRTTDQLIRGVDPTEDMILDIKSEQEITIKGKRYLIKPVD